MNGAPLLGLGLDAGGSQTRWALVDAQGHLLDQGHVAGMSGLQLQSETGRANLRTTLQALAHAIRRSCEIKAWVVGQDEREAGLRAILNFGHTFGHAIEAGLGYGSWLHGEAVGCGMVMAATLSHKLGLVDAAFVKRLAALVARAGLPVSGPLLGADRYLELMRVDKKAEAGEIRLVLIDGPGQACVRAATDALVREVIDDCCR